MPLVWQSSLRNGGSTMARSMVPLSSAGVGVSHVDERDERRGEGDLTRKFQRLRKVIKHKLGKHRKPVIMLQQIQLRPWLGRRLSVLFRSHMSR